MTRIDPQRLRALQEAAKTPDQIRQQAEPGALSGAISAIPQGVGAGLSQVQALATDFVGSAYQPVLDAQERITGISAANPFFYLRDEADAYTKRLKPDAMTTGVAGQVMFDLSRVMTQVAGGAAISYFTGGAGAPAMLAGATTTGLATGRATFNDLTEKGIDPGTAANIAYVDALMTGGGVAVPAAIGFQSLAAPAAAVGLNIGRGAYYAANAAYGAGANIAMGVTQRSATYDLLSAGGHKVMAEQYAPLDAAAITAEGLLGVAFSALGARAGLPSRMHESTDAALAARNAKHAAIDTAPGLPSDPATAAAHDRALQSATQQLLNGESVNVAESGIEGGSFVTRPRDAMVSEMARDQYRMELAPQARYTPSDRLVSLPPPQRTRLRFDAPELNEYAAQVEQQYDLPPGLINAIKNAGERSNSNQTSPAGARGVMQFMPENLRKYGVTDPTDPAQMIDAAGRYLRDTMRQYGGNVDAVIADYNGGPRQAREVLAGRQPKASETRAYMQRVRQWLGREGESPAERRRAQSDDLPIIPREQAQAARAIGTEIGRLEEQRAEIIPNAGQAAQVGQISQVRAELEATLADLSNTQGDAHLREMAKEIQQSTPRTSYKQALSQAKKQQATKVAELQGRIDRLEQQINQNAEADRSAQRLSRIDEELEALRANRDALGDVPPAQETPISSAVRGALDHMGMGEQGYSPMDSGLPSGATPINRGTSPTTPDARMSIQPARTQRSQAPVGEVAAPEARDGEAAPARSEAPDSDPETQAGLAILEEQGDIIVPIETETGEVVNVSLKAALAEADAELQYGKPEAFNAAVACFMRGGM